MLKIDELSVQAFTDPLTELFNRRYFMQKLEEEINRSTRYKNTFSLFMVDIERFKQINDSFGHKYGDKILHSLAELLLRNLRRADIPCRYGGEEFLILLPETNKEKALIAAERIREEIESFKFPRVDYVGTKVEKSYDNIHDDFIQVTISGGICDNFDQLNINADDLIRQADKALYRAKQLGRNRLQIE